MIKCAGNVEISLNIGFLNDNVRCSMHFFLVVFHNMIRFSAHIQIVLSIILSSIVLMVQMS